MDPLEFMKNLDAEATEARKIQKQKVNEMGIEGAIEMAKMVEAFRREYKRSGAGQDEVTTITATFVTGLWAFMGTQYRADRGL